MTKFNIGDKVKVVDNGKSYTTYQTWADVYGLKNYKSKEFYCPNNGTVATIVAKAKHLGGNEMLVGIRIENGDEYIIEDKGLELISPSLKSMLTNGRRVKLRNGRVFVMLEGVPVAMTRNGNVLDHIYAIKYWDNGLTHPKTCSDHADWDVMEIYEAPKEIWYYFKDSEPTALLWQREEKTAKQLQLEELQKQAQAVADAIKKLQDEE